MFLWWQESDARAHRAFVAASLGWMLDSFDVMIYAMVLASLIEDPVLHLSLSTAGILNSVTLLAAAVGGVCFGVFADRAGRGITCLNGRIVFRYRYHRRPLRKKWISAFAGMTFAHFVRKSHFGSA